MNNFNNSSSNFPQSQASQTFRKSPRRRSSWWVPVLIVVGVLAIFFIAIISFFGYLIHSLERTPVTVSKNSILKLDLANIEEYSEVNPFSILLNQSQKASFLDVLNAIKSAKTDDRIKGIYYECLAGSYIEPVKAAELQEVLLDFKKSGKFIYSYIEAASENDYFNALPSDSIFVSSEAVMELNGFGVTTIFLKDLYEKIGLNYTVIQCEDFKSAGEQYFRKKISDSARYQIKVLIQQKEDKFVEAVSKYRNMTKEEVLKSFKQGFYSADSLVAKKLVDVIMSKSDVKQFLHNKANQTIEAKMSINISSSDGCCASVDIYCDAGFIGINRYVASLRQTQISASKIDEKNSIAIIYGSGVIVSKEIESMPFTSSETMIVAEDFVQYLKEAREDNDIKAIILRLDSPGGSVIASETIYQEVIKTKQVKPVYASMSDVAASGAYYIAMACDTIIAHPRTITGSIGVLVAVPNFSSTIDKLGITVDTVSTGNGSPFFLNPLLPKNSKDIETLKSYAFDTYYRFLTKAAAARNKTFEEMRKIAKGRVWTGEDAQKIGLVDVLGGLNDAIDLVKRRLEVEENKRIKVYVYPNEPTKWSIFFKYFADSRVSLMSNSNSIIKEYFEIVETLSVPCDITKQLMYNFRLSQLASKEKMLLALPHYHMIK